MEEAASRPYPDATGRRIVAGLIDLAVLVVVFAVMAWLFGDRETVRTTTTGANGTSNDTTVNFNLTDWGLLAYLLIVAVYYIAFEALLRATPGKLVTGLRVVSVSGEPLSFGRIIVRNVLRIVDVLPFFYIVGLITIAASKGKQRIGDMAAATNVSYAKEPAAPATAPLPPYSSDPPQPT